MNFVEGSGEWSRRFALAEQSGSQAVTDLVTEMRKIEETPGLLLVLRRCFKYLGREEEAEEVTQRLESQYEEFKIAVAGLSPRERLAQATELRTSKGVRLLSNVRSWEEPFESSLLASIFSTIDACHEAVSLNDYFHRLRITGSLVSLAALIDVAANSGADPAIWETNDRLARLLLQSPQSYTPPKREKHLLASYALAFKGLTEDERETILSWRDLPASL